MNFIRTLAVVLTALLNGGFAQAVSYGSCPKLNAIPNLNIAQYGGLWYEYSRFFNGFEIGQSCANAIYTPKSDGTIGVLNRAKKLITGQAVSIIGSARQVSPPSGALLVTFQNVPSFSSNANYLILATDYSTYAVVWSCTNVGVNNLQLAWILTRKQFPDQSTINKAFAVFDSKGIDHSRLIQTSQSNCSVPPSSTGGHRTEVSRPNTNINPHKEKMMKNQLNHKSRL